MPVATNQARIFPLIAFAPGFYCQRITDRRQLLLDHAIRPRQHVGRNRQADLFRGFQIGDERELLQLLYSESYLHTLPR
jgi:hypothetical protein